MSARYSWDRARADASMLGHRPQRASLPRLNGARTLTLPTVPAETLSKLIPGSPKIEFESWNQLKKGEILNFRRKNAK